MVGVKRVENRTSFPLTVTGSAPDSFFTQSSQRAGSAWSTISAVMGLRVQTIGVLTGELPF
jgi:hypothetical protein